MPIEFDNTILQIADNLKRPLVFIPREVKQKCEEIRLRAGLPVSLTVGGKVLFVCKNSTVCSVLPKDPLIATNADVQNSLALLCNNSVYLHENEIRQGFISLSHGNRAGVSGVFNAEGMLVSVSSINIRIARQIINCADYLVPFASEGLLIAGPPGSGKTTALRDIIRLISNGKNGEYCRVTVIDSRGEISGGGRLDLGVNTDVLFIPQKDVGVDIALRTMNPQYIAFDEIGTLAELQGVGNCFNAGVSVITTAHSLDKYEIIRRDVIRKIIESGALKNVAVLPKRIGERAQIFAVQELKDSVCH